MKRRTAKPFTVEVRKGGARKRDTAESDAPRNDEGASRPAIDDMAGRGLRFRDAEKLFRGADFETPPPVTTPSAGAAFFKTPEQISDVSPAAPRRILPDLVAEAALSEATLAALPLPRRRGRPPKALVDGGEPRPAAKRGRPRRVPLPPQPAFSFFDMEEPRPAPVTPAVPSIRYLAASERRRARRDTTHLPRGERWKRRLPKVCW